MVICILSGIVILQIISGIRQTKEINLLNLYTVHFLVGKEYTLAILHEIADNQVYAVNFYRRFNKLESFVRETYPTYDVFPLRIASYKISDSILSEFESNIEDLQIDIHEGLGIGGRD